MKFSSMRSAVVIASVIVGSVIPSQAFAQTDFHVSFGAGASYDGGGFVSEYVFKQSMILNSIGFYTNGASMTETSFSFGNESPLGVNPELAVDSNGFRWYEFSGGMSINAGTTLKVYTNSTPGGQTPFYNNSPTTYNYSSDVIEYNGAQPSGQGFNTNYVHSNIRVSNPGSNVAPEPGSFALALTGGAALIGVCIRRRRNAA
jgi:hypothetical protein